VDDGCKVSAKIYGAKAEETIEEGNRAIIFSRVLCVSSIGNFHWEIIFPDLNPQLAIDSIYLIERFRDLSASGYLLWYDEFYIIDGDDPEDPNDDYFKTNKKIYTTTVTNLLNNVDTCTNGYSRVVVLMSSHGQSNPTGMCTYDTLGGWGIYTPNVSRRTRGYDRGRS